MRKRSEAQPPRRRPATRCEMAAPLPRNHGGAVRAVRLRDEGRNQPPPTPPPPPPRPDPLSPGPDSPGPRPCPTALTHPTAAAAERKRKRFACCAPPSCGREDPRGLPAPRLTKNARQARGDLAGRGGRELPEAGRNRFGRVRSWWGALQSPGSVV